MPSTEVRRIPIVQTEEESARSTPTSSSSSSTHQHQQQHQQVVAPLRRHKRDKEYQTTKKVEVKTTKNTEKRIQRQVVNMHNGKIIARASPEIVFDTVEDFRKHEEDGEDHEQSLVNYVDRNVVDDSYKRTVNTHEVDKSMKTTSVSNHLLGLVKRKELKRALRDRRPLSEVLHARPIYGALVPSKELVPKEEVLYSSRTRRKIVDTEDVRNVSRLNDDGKITTETFKTEKHEIIDDDETPDNDNEKDKELENFEIRDGERFKQVKREDFTEYIDREGRVLGRGAGDVCEEKEMTAGRYDWDEVEERIRRNRRMMRAKQRLMMLNNELETSSSQERKDALTRRPLNFHQEEKTRRKETDKWLERHFGSDWSLNWTSSNTSSSVANNNNKIRRSMSFSSVPILYVNPRERTKTKKVVKTTTTTTSYGPGLTDKPVLYTTKQKEKTVQPIVYNVKQPAVERKYHSTLSLNAPKKDYSLHGGSGVSIPVVHSQKHRSQSNYGGAQQQQQQYKYQERSQSNHAHYSDQPIQQQYKYQERSQSNHYNEQPIQQQYKYQERSQSNHYNEQPIQQQYKYQERSQSHYNDTHQRQEREENYHRTQSNHGHYNDTQRHERDNEKYHRTQSNHDTHRHESNNRHVERQRAQSSHTEVQQRHQNNNTEIQRHRHRHRTHQLVESSAKPFYHSQIVVNHVKEAPYRAHSVAVENENNNYSSSKLKRSKSSSNRVYNNTEEDSSNYLYVKQHQYKRQPLYITEFHRDKLYPATSENNLLFSSGRFQSGYLGARRMERSDAASYHTSNSSSSHENNHVKRKERKRSQSFAVQQKLTKDTNRNEEYVYDRYERKFVPNLRHGHSDLRLDRGFKTTYPQLMFSKEIVRERKQIEPQRFKTIIFLNGT